MQQISASVIWDDLKPRIDALIATRISASGVRSAGASGGAVSAHALSGALHTGLLGDGQAPQFLLRSGGRSLTGDLAVDSGIMIDGVDISAHAANTDAHHNQAHVLATALALGPDHSISGATAGHVLRSSSSTTAEFAQLAHTDLNPATVTSDQHHAKLHAMLDTDHHSYSGGAAYDVFGLSAASTLARLTPSYDVSGGASAILRSNAGALALDTLAADTSVTTPFVTAVTNLQLAPSVDLQLYPVGDVLLGDGLTFRTDSFSTTYPIEGMIVAETAVAGQYGMAIGVIEADELRVRVFVADEVRIDRGEEVWAKSYGITTEDFTTPGSIGGTVIITFESSAMIPGALFSIDDWVLFRTIDIDTGIVLSEVWGQMTDNSLVNFVQFWDTILPDSFMPDSMFPKIDQGTTTQDWEFTLRDGDTSYRIPAGSLGIDYGASGQSYIAFSVTDPIAAPYIRIRRWTGSDPYSPANHDDTVYIGNLNGVDNVNLAGNRGIWVQNSAETAWAELSDAGIALRNTSIALYDGATQTVNIGASGTDFWMGTSSADKRLYWNGTTLAITGQIVVTSGSSGYANITDKPTTLSDINGTEGTKLSGIAAGATVGATWGTNLNSIPTRFGDAPGAAGLYLTATHLGYYNGSAWKAWIASSGEFYFGGSSGAHLEWNGTKLRGLGTDGTTEQWYADSSDGKLYAGAGAVSLSSDGVRLNALSGKYSAAALQWYESTTRRMSIGTEVDLGAIVGTYIDCAGYQLQITATTLDVNAALSVGGNLTVDDTYYVAADKMRARDSGGLRLEDDAGTLSIHIKDGGTVSIEGSFDQAWTAVTYSGTWADYGGGFTAMKYRKIGDVVFVRGVVKRTGTSGTTICTLPSGYRPAATLIFTGHGYFSAYVPVRVDVDSSGNVICLDPTSGAAITYVSVEFCFSVL